MLFPSSNAMPTFKLTVETWKKVVRALEDVVNATAAGIVARTPIEHF
jgi:hypothetical protein